MHTCVCVSEADRQRDSLWESKTWDLCVTAFASLSVQHILHGGLGMEWRISVCLARSVCPFVSVL